METENPFSRDDMKVVYGCKGAPEVCYDCDEIYRCNFPLEFGFLGSRPQWMFSMSMDLLKENMRAEAQFILEYYLSYVGDEELEVQLRGILEGLPQTPDLWKPLSAIFEINDMPHEARISLEKGLETHPRSMDLLFMLTKGDEE